ncbi:VOC family protein [Kordia sp.]|uniref:VOC family protein n=1 Tax=Kordia sp. TaxID=1965332 RepID=UPI003B5CB91C
MKIERIDHIVLTVKNIEETIEFYTNILGMKVITFGENRKALTFGNQKINLHEKGKEFEPKAKLPTVGAADLCFIVSTKIETVKTELLDKNIEIVEGIVERTGATGKIRSIYLRDPDQNLIELSNHIKH